MTQYRVPGQDGLAWMGVWSEFVFPTVGLDGPRLLVKWMLAEAIKNEAKLAAKAGREPFYDDDWQDDQQRYEHDGTQGHSSACTPCYEAKRRLARHNNRVGRITFVR
jgi:hypothetical protein